MKIYDLSQPLNQEVHAWPYYPPFEVKYIKRKSEHGVNAQYIQTSNHIGTHMDAPRHFVTGGLTIDQIPLEWVYGPGVIVDLSDVLDDLDVYSPEMIESRVEVREGDILILHTGWHRYAQFGETPDEERYILMHPGAHPDMVPWLLDKKIHLWGLDAVSTDHPMNLPIGRFLGKGMFGQCDKVRMVSACAAPSTTMLGSASSSVGTKRTFSILRAASSRSLASRPSASEVEADRQEG